MVDVRPHVVPVHLDFGIALPWLPEHTKQYDEMCDLVFLLLLGLLFIVISLLCTTSTINIMSSSRQYYGSDDRAFLEKNKSYNKYIFISDLMDSLYV